MRLSDSLLRVVVFIGVLTVFAASLCPPPSFANDKDKQLKAQAEALLAKSRDLSNIQAPGSPGFALNAKIHYQLGAQTAEGDGQIIWMAPDHCREAYTAPNYFYAEIARDGYRYFSRTNDEMPFLMYELRATLNQALQALPKVKEKIRQVSSGALTCISFKSSYMTEVCLDNDGDVASAKYDWPGRSPVWNQQYEFSDFTQLGAKRFPRKIVFRGGDGHTIAFDVTQLAFIKDAGVDVFKVPIPATRETWCAEPKEDRTMERPAPDRASAALRFAGAVLYCVVRPSGRVRSAQVIYSSKPVDKKILDEWTDNERLATMSCGNDGIEYQIVLDYTF